ncbi:MAG: hypothetical protein B7Y39_04375 [Bdellovibrio sp. 28-41-41]|nr:MAG: hypothetical protein B7Y39_04375 [Bdellovibrio sp. 28-41-41]
MKSVKTILAMGAFIFWGQKTLAHGGQETRIALEPEIVSTNAGHIQYKFQLIDTTSKVLVGDQDLVVAHEKKLHFIIYDSSLREFQHAHPAFDGIAWSVDIEVRVNGNYWVWVQGELASDGEEFSSFTKLDILGGVSAWPLPPTLVDERAGASGVSSINLGKNKLVAGKMAMVDLKISHTDGTIPQLEPYLGAFAHVIAVPEDGDSLIHVHPQQAGSSSAMLHATFPKAGLYRLWIQFIDDGNLKTIPLAVKVN